MKFFTSTRIGLMAGVAVLASSASIANAQVIASWNYNTLAGNNAAAGVTSVATSSVFAGNIAGLLTWNYDAANVFTNAGSLVNHIGSDTAGSDISFINGTANPAVKFATFQFDTTNPGTGATYSFTSGVRKSSTGPTNIDVSISNDGSTFTSLGALAGTFNTTYSLGSIALPSSLFTAATGYVRLTVSGGSSGGTLRFDNSVISAAAATPGPSALLPFAMGVPMLASRLRRRRK